MANIYLIFVSLIYCCISDAYKNICYHMVDDFSEKVNLQVNKKLLFFPEFVKIFTETLNNNHAEVVERKITDTFYLQKSAFPCNDALVYAVPWTKHPLQTVNFTLLYIKKEFVIDEFITLVKPNFVENVVTMDGLMGLVKIKVVLIHKTSVNLNQTRTEPEFFINIENESIIPKNKEIYCMAFLTTDFSNILAFPRSFFNGYSIYKYYIFTISTFPKRQLFKMEKQSYLVKVFPCKVSTFLHKRLEIMFDPKITNFSLEIKHSSFISYFYNRYDAIKNSVRLLKTRYNLDFSLLKITQRSITKTMVNKRKNMLIYLSKKRKLLCPIRLPENFDKLGLSYVEIQRKNFGVVYKKGYYVEYSMEEFQIFNIKPGIPSETDLCSMRETL